MNRKTDGRTYIQINIGSAAIEGGRQEGRHTDKHTDSQEIQIHRKTDE
jgi:hypothetical protein